jgi:hypothetical protein
MKTRFPLINIKSKTRRFGYWLLFPIPVLKRIDLDSTFSSHTGLGQKTRLILDMMDLSGDPETQASIPQLSLYRDWARAGVSFSFLLPLGNGPGKAPS